MPENIIGFVRDVIVIGYLFVLRIGVPLIITLFIGWWLERKLAERDAREAEWLKKRRAEKEAPAENAAPQER